METDPSKIRRAADYRNARRTLALAGTWSMLFGVTSVMFGWLWTPVDWVLTVLGVALLVTGVWNVQTPRPIGILADAVTVLLVGAYNLVGAVLAVMDGLPPSPMRAFLGVLPVGWGVQRLRSFTAFANAFLERPGDAEAKEIDQTVWAIRRALAGAAGVIELTVRRRAWKAKLVGDEGVFVEVAGPGLLVASRRALRIAVRGEAAPGAMLEGLLLAGNTRLPVSLSTLAFRQYEEWKAGAAARKPHAA